MTDGPYSLGQLHWPGVAKSVEECGELLQTLGKLMAAGGEREYFDGRQLRLLIEDELADVLAATGLLAELNALSLERISKRVHAKQAKLLSYHEQGLKSRESHP